MNFFLNLLWKHVLAAVLENWFSTLVGIVGFIALGWGPLADKYLAGHDWNGVDWSAFGAAFGVLVWGALTKFVINWSLVKKLAGSAPKAEPVEKSDPKS